MERNDDKDFYRSFSKKKLQELCRSYGLSPYMTKPNLVNSLYSYFKVNVECELMLFDWNLLWKKSIIFYNLLFVIWSCLCLFICTSYSFKIFSCVTYDHVHVCLLHVCSHCIDVREHEISLPGLMLDI